MERFVAYDPKDAAVWQEGPKFPVHLNEPFRPFTVTDFSERNILASDFLIALPFALEGVGTGEIAYQRSPLPEFDPGWIVENAATPLGPASLSYQFRVEGNSISGQTISPLELITGLYLADKDLRAPDQLITFPNYDCSILGRFERAIHFPDLPPLAKYQFFLLPQQRKVEAVYLPENPKVLSDITVMFLAGGSR